MISQCMNSIKVFCLYKKEVKYNNVDDKEEWGCLYRSCHSPAPKLCFITSLKCVKSSKIELYVRSLKRYELLNCESL